MPDLTAFLEARAALDQHLRRLSSEEASCLEPQRPKRRSALRSAGTIGGGVAVVLAAAPALLLHGLPGVGSGKGLVDQTQTLSAASPSAGSKSDMASTDMGLAGLHPMPVNTGSPTSGSQEVAHPATGEGPRPAPAPAPAKKIAGLLEPNPPGRYDFEQESTITGSIAPSESIVQPSMADGKIAEVGAPADAQLRSVDPSTDSPKVAVPPRRTRAPKAPVPVAVKRVGSGVASLFTWLTPAPARPSR
jgi:hypothetical protein